MIACQRVNQNIGQCEKYVYDFETAVCSLHKLYMQ